MAEYHNQLIKQIPLP